ncbi:MAG: hypothetical protein M1825_004722 [Sarcosagium campestre]|nr:MAG: hypothetical protein M1825_004722 [Sarcosagium campestre]
MFRSWTQTRNRSSLLPFTSCDLPRYHRSLHRQAVATGIPPPTPFVPDPTTFLKLIGRNLVQHAAKFPTWEALFTPTSTQLRELGLEPARDRRYLLRWREKFRNGEYGVGGDLTNVVDGTAHLKVIEIPLTDVSSQDSTGTVTRSPGMRRAIVNIPPNSSESPVSVEGVRPIQRLKIRGAHTIRGPYVTPVKGTQGRIARLAVQEGMWEHRRGRKIDGGERRRAEVRAKRAKSEKDTS